VKTLSHVFITVNPLNYVEWRKSREDLGVIKLGNVQIGEVFEPVLLVEKVIR